MALVMIAHGRRAGWTFEDAFSKAEELGCPIEHESLHALVEECLPLPEEEEAEGKEPAATAGS